MTLQRLEQLYPALENFSALAKEYGIDDVFQDNNGKTLQLCLALDLRVLPGRNGNDVIDVDGRECEMKTTTTKAFTTHHHMTPDRVDKYSKVPWIFALYDGFKLREVYRTEPGDLDDLFMTWLEKLDTNLTPLNNPKISLGLVRRVGRLLFSSTD
jgi:hypothetical protein